MARVTQITSRSNPLLAQVRKLVGDAGGYRRSGKVLLEGEHLCAAWLDRGGATPQAIVAESGWSRAALRDLAGGAVEIAVVADDAMAGVGTLGSAAPIAFLIDVPASSPVRPLEPTLVLDRVQDPGNVGSMLRSAAAFGFGQVIALVGTAALWSPKVVRAGMGAHFGLRLVEAADEAVVATLELPLYGTSSHSSERLDGAELAWPCAFVLGHEGQGVSAALAARCAAMLSIPQPGGEESLNVAAAAAVCFYESARRRGP